MHVVWNFDCSQVIYSLIQKGCCLKGKYFRSLEMWMLGMFYCIQRHTYTETYPFKYEAQTALFKDPVRTEQ